MIKRKFTKEEDSKICQLVKQYGAKKWDEIARNIPGRTGRQCRDRYQNYLHPGFFNGEWTNEEDELLYEIFNLMPNKWSKIVKFFPRRSANSLKNRWHYFVSRNYNNINNKYNHDKSTNQNVVQMYIPIYYIPANVSPQMQMNSTLNEGTYIHNGLYVPNEIQIMPTYLINFEQKVYE